VGPTFSDRVAGVPLLEMPLSKRPLSPAFDRVARIPVVLLLLLSSSAVRAQDDAKAHYQKATAHFAVGEYHDAAIEYEEAFKLKQDPAILFNAAQAFRLAGENQKALLLYNNIIKLYPGTQYAKDSKERIQKLAESGTSPSAGAPTPELPPVAPPPVTPIAPAPAAPPVVVTPAAPPPSAPAAVIASPTPPPTEDHPIYARWWFWTGAGVLVVGAVVAAIALSSSSGSAGSWNNLPPVTGVR
jgi:tetratricopeptide (TPR) repeat protein